MPFKETMSAVIIDYVACCLILYFFCTDVNFPVT